MTPSSGAGAVRLSAPATVMIAVLLSVPVLGCSTAAAPAPIAPPAPTTTVAASTTRPTPVPVPSTVRTYPGQPPMVSYGTVPDAVVGVAYEYHLFVHCGIDTAFFAGRDWIADPPVGNSPPDEAGMDQYLVGAMTLLAPDRARFEWSGGQADFVPQKPPISLCA